MWGIETAEYESMLTKTAFAITAAGLAFAALPAQAEQNGVETRSLVVSHADIDLRSEAGAAIMLQRLERASRRVCDGGPRRRPLAEIRQIRACRTETLENAVNALDAPLVTALHHGHGMRLAVASLDGSN